MRLEQGPENRVDLKGQLPRGHQNQRATAVGQQALDQGDPKREGLTGSGLGDSQDILSLQRCRDGLMLDRCRSDQFEPVQNLDDFRVNAQVVKCGDLFSHEIPVFLL